MKYKCESCSSVSDKPGMCCGQKMKPIKGKKKKEK